MAPVNLPFWIWQLCTLTLQFTQKLVGDDIVPGRQSEYHSVITYIKFINHASDARLRVFQRTEVFYIAGYRVRTACRFIRTGCRGLIG